MPKGVYFIGNTDDSAHYSDAKDIEVIGGERNIWTTTVYKNEISGTKYAVRLHRVQCGSKKLGAIQSTRYARSGSVEGSAGSTPLEYAVPGSIGESIVSFACNPAQEVASKNVSRVPTGVSVIEYTDYLIFVAEQPKHCFTDAHMMRALGLAELAKEMEKKCIEESQSNSPTEPSSGLY